MNSYQMVASQASNTKNAGVIAPYGGKLVDLMVPVEKQEEIRKGERLMVLLKLGQLLLTWIVYMR